MKRLLVLTLVAGLSVVVPGTSAQADGTTPSLISRTLEVGYEGHACALMNAGSVQCWGHDWGFSGLRSLTDVREIGSGGSFTCALTADGSVPCFGLNWSGVVSLSSGVRGATGISVGGGHACALLVSKDIECWGTDQNGESSHGAGSGSPWTQASPKPLGFSDVVQVAAGSSNTCVLHATKRVECWGDSAVANVPFGSASASQIDAFGPWACAVLSTQSVRCWGQSDAVLAVPAGLPPAARVSVGAHFACALTTTKEVWCWGQGQDATTPRVRSSQNPVDVSAGGSTFQGNPLGCALLASGRVTCWGEDLYSVSAGASTLSGVKIPASVDSAGNPGDPVAQLPVNMPGTDHYYAVVPGTTTWENAKVAAESSAYNGIPGHLATVTSAAEHQFLVSTFGSYRNLLIGGRDTGSGGGYLMNWIWDSGPESGTVFSRCRGASDCDSVGTPTFWASAQPDDGKAALSWGVAQPYLQMLYSGSPSGWDDTHNGDVRGGYLVEYEQSAPGIPAQVVGLSSPVDSFSRLPDTRDDSMRVIWPATDGRGSSVSTYVLQMSDDGKTWSSSLTVPCAEVASGCNFLASTSDRGVTWDELRPACDGSGNPFKDANSVAYLSKSECTSSISITLVGLAQSQARMFRIAAVNAVGQGRWSASFLATTGGFGTTRLSVVDSGGMPVIGGQITWRMDNGSAKSSITYGLTADGVITIPAPAGNVTVSLKQTMLQDGALVTGTWHTVLGFRTNVLQLPQMPNISTRTIHVQLKSGQPLSNVSVALSDFGDISSSVQVDGFTFSMASSSTSGTTNTAGDFVFTGFMDQDPWVTVTYDDGIISQTQSGRATGDLTTVRLQNLPFATFDAATATGSAGAPVSVVVSAGTGGIALRRAVMPGVTVSLISPSGAALKCLNSKTKQVLSAKTNARGKATLTICPTRSGVYSLKTKGALSVGAVTVLVKGSVPLPVNSVTASSPGVGRARISWAAPIYNGGSDVLSYTVTFTAAGKKTVTRTIKATVNTKGTVTKTPATLLDVTGLANATTYTVAVVAANSKGSSDTYQGKVPVA